MTREELRRSIERQREYLVEVDECLKREQREYRERLGAGANVAAGSAILATRTRNVDRTS